MPPKAKTRYVCRECEAETPKWMGRCPSCGAWNSLDEDRRAPAAQGLTKARSTAPMAMNELSAQADSRRPVGIEEFDRVLGGGVVPGALILLGGEPGIGKSTLLLQVAQAYGERWGDVLYVSGEESPAQVRLRAERLGCLSARIRVLPETDPEAIAEQLASVSPSLIIVDSIQTLSSPSLSGHPGSVTQVRDGSAILQRVAKERGIPVVFVGHVTKQGGLAGPKVLEHMVDVVLQFEGDRYTQYRMLRTTKNRFGATSELGMFEMAQEGLVPITDPSGALLAERPKESAGSIVVAAQEGCRSLLVELQALVGPTAFGGTPRRQVSGLDYSRTSIVLAVLERRLGLQLQTHDIYLNVAGGMRIEEPAADLGVALAVASSFRNKPVGDRTLIFGEVGLAGEVRAVGQAVSRLDEAARMGFTRCILPKGNAVSGSQKAGLELIPVSTVLEAIQAATQAEQAAPARASG